MNKTFILNQDLRSATFLGAPAESRGFWVALTGYVSERETSGTIAGARLFTRGQWTVLAGAGAGPAAIERLVNAGLAVWRGDDLQLRFYDQASETAYAAKRAGAAAGGRKKAEKARLAAGETSASSAGENVDESRQNQEDSESRETGGVGSAYGTATASGIGNASPLPRIGEEREVEEGQVGEGQVEGSDDREGLARRAPEHPIAGPTIAPTSANGAAGAPRSWLSPHGAQNGPATPRIWTSETWYRQFAAAWSKAYGGTFYGRGVGDAKSQANLGDLLASLPEADRVTAQERATAMFEEFFADESQASSRDRHPFSLFVLRFNGARASRRGGARSVKDATTSWAQKRAGQ